MTVRIVCFCAAWCRTCEKYRSAFEFICSEFDGSVLRSYWIDIEEEAEKLVDIDIETFPTILVFDQFGVRFAGPLDPHPEVLRRIIRACLADEAQVCDDFAYERLATSLRQRM